MTSGGGGKGGWVRSGRRDGAKRWGYVHLCALVVVLVGMAGERV